MYKNFKLGKFDFQISGFDNLKVVSTAGDCLRCTDQREDCGGFVYRELVCY